ncbi:MULTISPECIES: DsbA family protein [unclassified Pedobacter]|uniref:DsbA family protein n=1 Tax=unclassified Pedobacter TaxID=2628915 RepID=UPI0022481838|nr:MULTISPECIES: thioredoxin domain-containing protein [unclassified Pedobacter]MCX2429180.1 thioredoxin domain-containing protein [Pedobacter sp. GR22-10]MCX2583619.1 thioredoxin domain-containing protein [Pedobacter sp. MR22-3]
MSTLKPAIGSSDHSEGSDSAAITIVEFGDYQCPHCAHAYPIIKEIQQAFGDQIRFVFRHFPLQESHAFAFQAALAAEAAALQGKFWEMHDAIYDNQYRLNDELFQELAETIGLDIEQFDEDINTEAVKQKVEDDFESGVRSGVNGTPSFYVNETKFDGGPEDLFEMLKENAE